MAIATGNPLNTFEGVQNACQRRQCLSRCASAAMPGLVAIAPTTVLMAPLGARIAHGFSARKLSVFFGLFLVIVSLRLFYSAIVAG